MSFSAGGANVGGVLQSEQGVLKIDSANTNFSGIGTVNVDQTVPAGKKWVIKNLSMGTAGFTGTITTVNIVVSIDGVGAFLYVKSGTSWTENLPNNIVLSAGTIVRFQVTSSVYTSGQASCIILHQEIDA